MKCALISDVRACRARFGQTSKSEYRLGLDSGADGKATLPTSEVKRKKRKKSSRRLGNAQAQQGFGVRLVNYTCGGALTNRGICPTGRQASCVRFGHVVETLSRLSRKDSRPEWRRRPRSEPTFQIDNQRLYICSPSHINLDRCPCWYGETPPPDYRQYTSHHVFS